MVQQLAIHDRLLRMFIEDAIRRQSDWLTRVAIARKLKAGHYRVISTFEVDRHDRLIPASMTAQVEILMLDGWAELCSIHWTQLGLEWADVMAEVESLHRQHAEGTYPDGPKDPTARTV
jgi:hypothetical protein